MLRNRRTGAFTRSRHDEGRSDTQIRPRPAGRGFRRVGFTLIELLVVAAIIAAMLAVTMPAIRSVMQSGQAAQADNTLRAALLSARVYAVQKSVAAGIRCQDDGRLVLVYARNMSTSLDPDNLAQRQPYDMKAVEGASPSQLPGPYRVTMADVGAYGIGYTVSTAEMQVTWIGPTGTGSLYAGGPYYGPPEFLDAAHTWFAFPVVLFGPTGRVIFNDCFFSGDPSRPWYPTLAGSFGKVTDADINNNPAGSGAGGKLKYTNQLTIAGWRCNGYKGGGSHWVPVEGPSMTARPRLFDYTTFRGISDPAIAVGILTSTARDFALEIDTGMLIRSSAAEKILSN
ncbi:MAG: prepilin-type N-terminal cleavage/methylation domain-containing protein [Phycisphaerae bacterium]|nr:prepilin-type N-terminal cleavage/methylation domain-containing protein [Phycisphaerae bacterium]